MSALALVPTITIAGLAAMAANSGIALNITHIQIGDVAHTITGAEVGLSSPKVAVPIAGGYKNSSGCTITGVFPAPATTYFVYEVGFWAGDPAVGGSVLFAIYSQTMPMTWRSPTSGDWTPVYVMAWGALSSSAINIVVDSAQSAAIQAMTNLIGTHEGKTNAHATLANLTLTGTPTAPTPVKFDSSTKIATTAAVKQAGLQYSGYVDLTASRTLLANDIGAMIMSSGTKTLTLPTPSSLGATAGSSFTLANVAGVCTVAMGSGATYSYGAAGLTSSFSVLSGESLTFVVMASTNDWAVVSSNALLGNTVSFTSSKNANGYQKLPGGLIIQWAESNTFLASGATTNVTTFPIAFPNSLLGVFITPYNNGAATESPVVRRSTGTNLTQLTAYCANAIASSTGYSFFAIGY
jgi:hypothetical protein